MDVLPPDCPTCDLLRSLQVLGPRHCSECLQKLATPSGHCFSRALERPQFLHPPLQLVDGLPFHSERAQQLIDDLSMAGLLV